MNRLSRGLLGIPDRSRDQNAIGRTQTRVGRWWAAHPSLLRGLALVALAWFVVYLGWRVIWSWRGASLWLAIPLLLAEIYGIWSLTALTWFGWRIPNVARPEPRPGRAVDVYVCTYDESAAVLQATLAGCSAIRYPHTTYLLDDGRRPEIAQLAREFGAEYMTRGDNANAKAGNINAALTRTQGELVLALDADHVPMPDVLDALVGYFDDSAVALVQTPHDFYNHDSVQHYQTGRHEQSVFYSVIMPGKERHAAAFWCGSGALIRREALLSVGGVAVETIAEDFHTTLKLQRAGWRTRYHDEVLIQGLAPHDLDGYLLQRDRWARGNLAVFGTPESPLRARELTGAQRLSYFASLSSYLAGPVRLVSLATLAVVLWTGDLPLKATPLTLGLLWLPTMLLSICAGSALCRGYQRVADTTHYELCTAEIYLRALRCIVRPGHTRFKVTPKHGVDLGGWSAVRRLRIVSLLTVVLAAGLAAQLLEDTGVVGGGLIPHLHGIARWVVPLLALFELRRLLRTLVLLATRRQLRAEYRVPLDVSLALTTPFDGGTPMVGRAHDITPFGLRLGVPGWIEPGTVVHAIVPLPTLESERDGAALQLEVVSCSPAPLGWTVGARIIDCDMASRRRVLEYCYIVAPGRRIRGVAEDLPAPTIEAAETPVAITARAG